MFPEQQQDFASQESRLLQYSQLCNVFYEREIRLLGECDFSPQALQRRMQALPFYIKRAAESLLDLDNPLLLDSQNGTWSATQKKSYPAFKYDQDKIAKQLTKHHEIGLVVPVEVTENEVIQLRLDCIDEVNQDGSQIHVNEHGWFATDGTWFEPDSNMKKRLLPPAKMLITAACCGHQWIGNEKTMQRTLTLRELLLTSVLNWPNLNKPVPLPH